LNAGRRSQNRLSEPDFDENGVCTVNEAAVEHIRLVISLVEGRWIDLAEIFTLLDKILRQHSIDSVVKLAYGGRHHHSKPP
jgi:hypothetical protein